MGAVQTCMVSISDLDKVTPTVQVQAETLFEAAAAAVTAFPQHPGGADALDASGGAR